ncbi:MAG TPA: hypothetical protein VLH94_01860 [Spirochaetia bacterium]|nr:hypothetical protein [Spirochaetia bacterium]
MQKEILNGEVMQEFMDGFADEGWKVNGNSIVLESEDGEEWFEYNDLGREGEVGAKEIVLWKGDFPYVLQEDVNDEGTEIRYYLTVPPYKDEYFNWRDNWFGVVYGPDGKMNPIRRVKGLPRKIDMDKTVELFLRQVAEKSFATPILVKAK